eukprot:230863_1
MLGSRSVPRLSWYRTWYGSFFSTVRPYNSLKENSIFRDGPDTSIRPFDCKNLREFSTSASNDLRKGLRHPRTATIIGAPISLGQPRVGVENGPDAVRNTNLDQRLMNTGWRIEDRGNLDTVSCRPDSDKHDTKGASHSGSVGNSTKKLADMVHESSKNGNFCVVIGGDHSLAIGSVSGMLKTHPDLGVLWVDAHADLHVPESSSSGNIHGMSVGFLMRRVKPGDVSGFKWLDNVPPLSNDRLVYIGLREVDADEKIAIKELGIKTFSMHSVDKYGIGSVTEMAIKYLKEKGVSHLHLSFDIDAVDPYTAPATGTTVRGGFTFREAHFIAENAAASNMLVSLDMVEVNPELGCLDDATATADTASSLIACSLGETLL